MICLQGRCADLLKKRKKMKENRQALLPSDLPEISPPIRRKMYPLHGTIFAIGISRISSAPQAFSFGISWFTAFFGTTVWML